jgi:hypothetical protein
MTAAERKKATLEQLTKEAEEQNAQIEQAINQHRKIESSDHVIADFLAIEKKPEKGVFLTTIAFLILIAFVFSPESFNSTIIVILGLPSLSWLFYTARKMYNNNKAHKKALEDRKSLYEKTKTGDPNAIESAFSTALDSLDFFFETAISCEVSKTDNAIYVDVDLPEIEDMPTGLSVVKRTRATIEKKSKTQSEIRNDYVVYIHGLALRIANIAFSLFNTIAAVTFSGYTQRPDPDTGNIKDDYVLSVNFKRYPFEKLNPATADPVKCVAQFDSRVKVLKNGLLETIEPFSK